MNMSEIDVFSIKSDVQEMYDHFCGYDNIVGLYHSTYLVATTKCRLHIYNFFETQFFFEVKNYCMS